MLSKQELAQPVGNAKIRGEFDTDASTAVGSNTNDAVLFPRLRSDHDGNMIRLFLAGTVLARRYKILERTDGDSFKAHDLALDQTVTVRWDASCYASGLVDQSTRRGVGAIFQLMPLGLL
jgi:hypothetical protein